MCINKYSCFTEQEERIIRLIQSEIINPQKLNKEHKKAFNDLIASGAIYLDHWENKFKLS